MANVSRPTLEELAHGSADLEHLAYEHHPSNPRNPTGFPDVATLLNLLVWVNDSIKAAREAAAYGPGVKDGYHTFGQHGHSDIDSRTRDQYLKELLNLRSGWLVNLGNTVDEMKDQAYNVGRWPNQSEQAG